MHQSTFFGGHENHQKCVKKSKYGTIFRENKRKWSKPLVQKPVGVVEAASSSLVTQTKIRRNCTNSYGFFFLFLLMFNIFLSFSFLIRLKVHTAKVCTRFGKGMY